MVIGGPFREVVVRSASTRDIDVVLIDRKKLDPETMKRVLRQVWRPSAR
jgi:hypothetical protein